MLERQSDLLEDQERPALVAVDHSIALSVQFANWLCENSEATCVRHHSTPLLLKSATSASRSMISDDLVNWPDMKTFEFIAVFACPACRVQYAEAPPEFWESTFAGFEVPTPSLETNLGRCREFAAHLKMHNRGFLLMTGRCGNGKTRLACNILREVNAGQNLYLTQGRLTTLHRAAYGHRFHFFANQRWVRPENKSVGEQAHDASILVLDELGALRLAADEMLLIDEIVKHRYDHGKPTILISNLPLTGSAEQPGLKEFLGDALTDRIRDATGNGRFILQFAEPSYRRGRADGYLHASKIRRSP